jgi:chromate transporter
LENKHTVTYKEAFRVWIKVALYSFGGPAGQISVMHRILVDEKKWISEQRFLHALNYCMLLPGPEAQQLATYIGWLLHGVRGGLTAGILFVVPGFISILILSVLYAGFMGLGLVEALFFGLKAAVLAIVVEAVFRIGKRALGNYVMVLISVLSFIAIFVFDVSFPLIILIAGVMGYTGGLFAPQTFAVIKGHQKKGTADSEIDTTTAIGDQQVSNMKPDWKFVTRTVAIWSAIWFLPVIVLALLLGGSHVFVQEGIFFSKAAVVTFGGAYAVLAYIAQQAVETYGWLEPGEMLDGLGMAETTPGPLIQVVQFVGFMGAYRNPGMFDPMVAGILGSIVTTWVTFVPCFLWIFLGAPFIERLRGNNKLTAALSSITAAVVGVVMNLAIWFSINTLFSETERFQQFGMNLLYPVWPSIDWAGFGIVSVAFFILFYLKWGMMKTLFTSILLGVLYHWIFL